MSKNLKQVWSCGGGTQSCAIGAMIITGLLPKPDIAVIADTGRETSTTWAYLDNVLNPALNKVGVNVERISAEKYGYNGNELFRGDELLIPAFTNQTGKVGKLSTFCNRWWKLDAIKVWLSRERGLTRSKHRSWIGFSFDEHRRYFRMMNGEEFKKGLIWLPLVEKRLRRHQSIEFVKSMGWPEPPRSRCYMCPNQGDAEWKDLKENQPLEFAEAAKIEKIIQERDPHAWLHPSCQPIDQVNFTDQQGTFGCDSGGCFI